MKNPEEIPALVALVKRMSTGRKLMVALESSGTYGDALRQALADAAVAVQRVSNKASHDYAEVFDGVPSQHDVKDVAVIAELAALGKSQPWAYQPASPWEQELTYGVEWMVSHRQILTTWQGRLEALVARHWPEATGVLKLSSGTLLRVLKHYRDPKALAADPGAAQHLTLDRVVRLLWSAIGVPRLSLEAAIELVNYHINRNRIARNSHMKSWMLKHRNRGEKFVPL